MSDTGVIGTPSESRNRRAVNNDFKNRKNHKEATQRANQIQLRHQQKIQANPRIARNLRRELKYTQKLYSEVTKQEKRTLRHNSPEHMAENTEKSNFVPSQFPIGPGQRQVLYKYLQSLL